MLRGLATSFLTSSALLGGASRVVLLTAPLATTALLKPACSRALSVVPLPSAVLKGAASRALAPLTAVVLTKLLVPLPIWLSALELLGCAPAEAALVCLEEQNRLCADYISESCYGSEHKRFCSSKLLTFIHDLWE